MNSDERNDWIAGAAKCRSAAKALRKVAKSLRANGTANDMTLAAAYEESATKSEQIADQAEARAQDSTR